MSDISITDLYGTKEMDIDQEYLILGRGWNESGEAVCYKRYPDTPLI